MKRVVPVIDLGTSERSVDGKKDQTVSPSDGLSSMDKSGADGEVEAKRARLKPVARKTFVHTPQNASGRQTSEGKKDVEENGESSTFGISIAAIRSDEKVSSNCAANDQSQPSTSSDARSSSSSTTLLRPPPLQKAPSSGINANTSRLSTNTPDRSLNGASSTPPTSSLTNGWKRQYSSASTNSTRVSEDGKVQTDHAPAQQTAKKSMEREELEYPIPLCRCTIPTELRNEEDPPTTCQAVSSVDGVNRSCSNSVGGGRHSSSAVGVPLFRPHVRCPFQALCVAHLRLLRLHHCCPTCGVFCLKGDFNKCSAGHPDHWFHRGCEGVSGACPHCLYPNFALDRVDVYQTNRSDDHQRPHHQKAHRNCASTSSAADAGIFEKSLTISGSDRQLTISRRLTVEDRDLLTSIFSRIEAGTVVRKHPSLELAIQADDVESVCCLISANCDVNANVNGSTPLHLAVERNALLIVYLLIEAGANPDALNRSHFTPLMVAAEKGFDGVVNALLLLGANPSISVTYKETTGCTALHIAASLQVPEVVWALVKCPRTNINAQTVDGEWTPLIYAVENERVKNVQLLLDRGAKPLLADLEGNVALHWAAFSGCVDVAECLLDKMGDRDLNILNLHKDSPLHVACRQAKWNMAGLLLERGADGLLDNASDPPETPESLAVSFRAPKHILDKFSCSKKRVYNRINWPNAKLAEDISRGHERIPIRVTNEVDRDWSPPDDFNYVSNIYESGESSHNIERRLDLMNACSCVDACSTNCQCCETEHSGRAYQKNGRLADDFDWGSACDVIVECSPACKCEATCQNRVVQKGMQVRVELFKTVNRGWAVRCLQRIPKGTYICEYAGEILTSDMADEREDDTYLFEIESGGHNHCIDAGKFGNISRFINHHCDPNLGPIKVLWDHSDRRYPHICFFARRDIPKGEELTFDYGDKFWEIKGRLFTCKCQASNCRYNEEHMEAFLESREQLANELSSGEEMSE